MKILGIESSCDDTSVALVERTDEKIEILAEKTASQIEIHKKYGGVVPEIAGRKHAEQITPVVEEIMKNFEKPDVIAVTSGPGLITGLIVGVETAKTLSYLWDVPIVGVNHIKGHIHSVKIQKDKSEKPISNFELPILSLVASGGHTELILSKKLGHYERVGGTRDDAAGECFDKVAKLLGFDYPGGPKISKFAEKGDPKAITFPRPMIHSKDFDMSFSGLKTAALYHLRDNPDTDKNDFCASFEQAIVDLLVHKTIKAAKKYNPKTIVLAGGVSANKKLRETLKKVIQKEIPSSEFKIPELKYSMDNAAMIAVTAYNHAKNKNFTPWNKLQADPNWKIYK
ncbi:tRNA (adenosine(37)-N6)-threonylcarbamoyltransferase complex transferase subunit TsaD [Candidatus Parcubacteria bacterium]|nr:tRNA (adenosine(37)-N6)-threonylcarbamoyltransferase complex transferase subunit TsaD [Candidatus Parcubacteria bacterium]MBT3948535.1 tRNA (adenosine(37)-N6)-threonylcarbamoyltransferase complex transferase subunit TsaD [Candidatus Parcubacteria bacterium]